MNKKDVQKKIAKRLEIDAPGTQRKLIRFIQRAVDRAGRSGVVVGLSGGLDSSLTATLCARALGPDRVTGISMPERDVTDHHDVAEARDLASKLGIKFRIVDITPMLHSISQNIADYRAGAQMPSSNMRPRLRMLVLYYYANLFKLLVAGTSNRNEIRAGYFTKYGDCCADLLPLARLYKTQVKSLAAHAGISREILLKVPTAGLWRGQTDEDELGITYEKLDMIYAGLDLKLKPITIARAAGVDVWNVKHFIDRESRMAHKSSYPQTPDV